MAKRIHIMKSSAKDFEEDFKINFIINEHSDEEYDAIFYRTLAAWYRRSADGKLIQSLVRDTPTDEIAALLGVRKSFIGTEIFKAVHGNM